MFDMARFTQIKQLLEAVETVAEALSPNERELFHHLTSKYAEPDAGDPDDISCLQVMLRNVNIRKDFDIDTTAPGRVIEVETKPAAPKD